MVWVVDSVLEIWQLSLLVYSCILTQFLQLKNAHLLTLHSIFVENKNKYCVMKWNILFYQKPGKTVFLLWFLSFSRYEVSGISLQISLYNRLHEKKSYFPETKTIMVTESFDITPIHRTPNLSVWSSNDITLLKHLRFWYLKNENEIF